MAASLLRAQKSFLFLVDFFFKSLYSVLFQLFSAYQTRVYFFRPNLIASKDAIDYYIRDSSVSSTVEKVVLNCLGK